LTLESRIYAGVLCVHIRHGAFICEITLYLCTWEQVRAVRPSMYAEEYGSSSRKVSFIHGITYSNQVTH